MSHTIETVSDTKIKATISLGADELSSAKERALVRLAPTVKALGFRTGKVPLAVAEKYLAASALNDEIINMAVNKAVVDAFAAENIQPLDRPQVEVIKYVPGELLEFSAETEVLPKITLGNYKKLKVDVELEKVTAKDVAEVLERMRAGFASKKELTRAAKDGDEVQIDFDGKNAEGKPVAGAKGKDYPLTLGSSSFIPGFEAGLVGKKAGDVFELPLSFPKTYHAKQLAGSKISFHISVKKVQEVTLPAVDDALAKKAGDFADLAALKTDIKKELEATRQQSYHDRLRDRLLEQLIDVSSVPVPAVLLHEQQHGVEREMTDNLAGRGQTLEQWLEEVGQTRQQWFAGDVTIAATRRVQAGLVLAELSKAEKIEVTTEELDQTHQQMMARHTDPKLRARFDTPEARRDLANRVLTEKTVSRLVALNS